MLRWWIRPHTQDLFILYPFIVSHTLTNTDIRKLLTTYTVVLLSISLSYSKAISSYQCRPVNLLDVSNSTCIVYLVSCNGIGTDPGIHFKERTWRKRRSTRSWGLPKLPIAPVAAQPVWMTSIQNKLKFLGPKLGAVVLVGEVSYAGPPANCFTATRGVIQMW